MVFFPYSAHGLGHTSQGLAIAASTQEPEQWKPCLSADCPGAPCSPGLSPWLLFLAVDSPGSFILPQLALDCAASERQGRTQWAKLAAQQMFLEPCFLFCCWAICFYSLSFLQGGFEKLPLLNGCFRFASIKPHLMKTSLRSSFS